MCQWLENVRLATTTPSGPSIQPRALQNSSAVARADMFEVYARYTLLHACVFSGFKRKPSIATSSLEMLLV